MKPNWNKGAKWERCGEVYTVAGKSKFVSPHNKKPADLDGDLTCESVFNQKSGWTFLGGGKPAKPLTKAQKKAARIQAKEDAKKAAEKKEAERAEEIKRLREQVANREKVNSENYEAYRSRTRELDKRIEDETGKRRAAELARAEAVAMAAAQKNALHLAGQTISALSQAARS